MGIFTIKFKMVTFKSMREVLEFKNKVHNSLIDGAIVDHIVPNIDGTYTVIYP